MAKHALNRFTYCSPLHEPLAIDQGALVLAALLRIGWTIKRQSGSHRTLHREGRLDYTFAFHDNDEIGPRMLSRIAKHTGLEPKDL